MRTLRALLAAVVVTIVASPMAARAVTVSEHSYSFTGQCLDCTGVGVGTLTLAGYTEGAAIQASNFVSFSYSSNLVPSFAITTSNFTSIFGSLGPTLPGFFDIQIFRNDGSDFFSSALGVWSLSIPQAADVGTAGVWGNAALIATPIPAALPLFATGLAGLGWLVRRRKKQAA